MNLRFSRWYYLHYGGSGCFRDFKPLAGVQPVLDEIAKTVSEGYPVFLMGDYRAFVAGLDGGKTPAFWKGIESPVSKSITLTD